MIVKNRISKKKKLNEEMSLQITSMADIFTIILVFLLKSFSTGLTQVSPTGTMSLPEGSSKVQIKETLKLEITSDTILIDQKPVVALKDFEFSASDLSADEEAGSKEIYALLSEQRKLLPEPNLDSTLLVMADERMPYSTLKRVITSAAQAGFVDLQLVVVQPD